ncbi:hypothetical protein H0H81_002137 [Sphagnurus paluster]|uniref:RNA helicase n=1 Tax=Sphagnurus paluster TaxID=117069 RepID=A0A9P7KLV3_9AGAR|nr:hypothetical protein H0H81_002137 [Sphagnurus paluster]
MNPGSRSANLEVAPRSRGPKHGFSKARSRSSREGFPDSKPRGEFSRDSVPHADPKLISSPQREDRNPSYRRKSRQYNAVDERPGKWSEERSPQGPHETRERRFGEGYRDGNRHLDRQERPQTHDQPRPRFRNDIPVVTEFSESNTTTTKQGSSELAAQFTSPPLMPGILSCLTDILGPHATPTPIQSLSLKWLLNDSAQVNPEAGWKQFLLASETGSGKSIAYLLPVLQNLKQAELDTAASPRSPLTTSSGPKRALNPRALILAPTHELSRQLAGFAKSLLHEVKLRVLCASRANMKSTKERDSTARQMVAQFDASLGNTGEFELKERSGFPVDVVVGTPMKLLEMVKGRGWDRKEISKEEEAEESELDNFGKPRRGRDKMVGFGKWRSQPEMGLANVEWVVVDEADVLFDPDFQETTRQLLADISLARGHPVPLPTPVLSQSSAVTTPASVPTPLDYPFNLILTSATIPSALATYLDTYHPKLMRLASPNLHHLPKTLQTEYVNWTGGNKLADIERRIRRVWAEDASMAGATNGDDGRSLSKVLIFCNKSSKVDELGTYLQERGIKNIALSSTSDQRKRGSNHHLDGFLRVRETGTKDSEDAANVNTSPTTPEPIINSDPKSSPHVMITTSLLSRGLDFSPSIRHVFIVDEPRNMIDFLHRAGRAGRAGERGKVVVFGKMKGRGSAKAKDVRKKVGSLVSH